MSGDVIPLVCGGIPLPYISCHNRTSGDVSRPVIDIRGGVQFLMNINPKG